MEEWNGRNHCSQCHGLQFSYSNPDSIVLADSKISETETG